MAVLREYCVHCGVGFQALCTYIEEPAVYEDYQNASAYVHGQDITTKMAPFTFYFSIYDKLFMMMRYIFKMVRLFKIDEELEDEVYQLEVELLELGRKYLHEEY